MLSTNINFKQNKIIYALNKESMTAGVIGNDLAYGNIFIPKSITYENQNFIITSINEGSFKFQKLIRSISFPADSEIRTIENESFAYSSIYSITIPSQFCKFEGEWCRRTNYFKKVKIMPNNPYFMCLNDQMILGKTNEKSDNYDDLIFVCRNIEKVTLPSFITQISSCAFSSSIVSQVVTTSNITKIGQGAFSYCDNLKEVEFPPDSKLQTIEKDAFYCSSIESLTIPSSVCNFEEGWNNCVKNLTKITVIQQEQQNIQMFEDKLLIGKSDAEKEEYDILIFASRDIRSATIPPSIKQISSFAFSNSSIDSIFINPSITQIGDNCFSGCKHLQTVSFPENSQLQHIGREAFSHSSIGSIFIPSQVTKICESCFFYCGNLKEVEFPPDSRLQTIEKDAFYCSSIESLTIPSSVCNFEEGWNNCVKNLTKITVIQQEQQNIQMFEDKFLIGKSDPEKEEYDILIFASRDIKSATIPPSIKIIGKDAFQYSSIEKVVIPSEISVICEAAFSQCKQLETVDIPFDSELKEIGEHAFSYSLIEKIFIPHFVTQIEHHTFCECQNLQHVEFPHDSELQVIKDEAFVNTMIKRIMIPSTVCELKENWCSQTPNLENVIIMSGNQRYANYNEDIVIGKSNVDCEEFDTLVFVSRKIYYVTIPPFIKIIGHCALNKSLINSIFIPPQVEQICENAFANCIHLSRVDFAPDSQLQRLDKFSFSGTLIDSLCIPSNLPEIKNAAFDFCDNLKIIEIDENSVIQSKDLKKDLSYFSFTELAFIMIPAHLRK